MTDNGSQSQHSSPNGGSQPSLTSRVVKSAGWVFTGKVAGRGLQLIKVVVLARLLTPEDFGLFGIVMLALATMETFTRTGFDKALIQRKDDAKSYLNTGWTVQIMRGCALAVVMFLAAPLVAWFFKEPRAVPLLRVLAFTEVLKGARNIGVIYFQKDLEFHKRAVYRIGARTISLVVGVIVAYQLRSVWALVWASLAGAMCRVILSYILHPYRPRLRWDATEARELFGYGKWLLGNSIFIYIGMKLDTLLVGRLLGSAALGFYKMGYQLSLLPLQETTYAVGSVLMPSYAKLQDSPGRLRIAYKRTLGIIALFSIPACLGVILVARPAVDLVLGEKWLRAVKPIQILMVAQLFKSIVSSGSPLFLGTGKPEYEFQTQLARAIVLAVLLVPAIWLFKLEGAALAVVGSASVMFMVYCSRIRNILGGLLSLFHATLTPSLAGATAMAAALTYPAVKLARYSGPLWMEGGLLAGLIAAGVIIHFTVALWVASLIPGSSIFHDVQDLVSKGLGMLKALRPACQRG